MFPASNAVEKEVRALIGRWISESASQSARWTTWNGGALPRAGWPHAPHLQHPWFSETFNFRGAAKPRAG